MNHNTTPKVRIASRSQRAESKFRSSFTSRSRGGCLTCKQKHVKCDETRPKCHKCAQKGWICGGYTRDLRWSYKHQPTTASDLFADNSNNASTALENDTETETESALRILDSAFVDDLLSYSTFLEPGQVDTMDWQLADGRLETSPLQPIDHHSSPNDIVFATPKASPASRRPRLHSASLVALQQTISANSPYSASHPTSFSLAERHQSSALKLLGNWFDEVCPAWSAFDSSMNMNRKLASDLWPKSATVFSALQSMSASFLSARMPQLRQLAFDLLKKATICIQVDLESINNRPRLDNLPTSLLFSLLCLGTTVCWLDTSRIGAPFLKAANGLLKRASIEYSVIAGDQADMMIFFQKSMVYWEMLVSVVDDLDLGSDNSHGLSENSPQSVMAVNELSTDTLLHPWTGISSMTQRLIARAMRLCRSYRRRLTKPTGRASTLSIAMQQIEEAQDLETRLLTLEFSTICHISNTGDYRTPRSHLTQVAKAYQLASLLQLYVTFPDLVSMKLPEESSLAEGNEIPWDKWIIPLALRLTNLLEEIPPDSGSRVIQPLLYICASTGLRLSLSSSENNGTPNRTCGTRGSSSSSSGESGEVLDYIEQIHTTASADVLSRSAQEVAIDIGIARNFILKRLNSLENTLQPKPIIVAKELIEAIWAAYDNEPSGCTIVHWLDVMEKKDLRSLFG